MGCKTVLQVTHRTFDQSSLDLDLEVIDAEGLYKSGDDLYITYANGKYYLQTRTFNYDVDWTLHFQVSQRQARVIVDAGYADWWMNVDKSVR